ncbi:MAG: LLM class F420-dependent oxidoreductase [Acidimicrobiales bacterium]|nr:LLM class F420-dependent oxidoreductase [Acidimicrobiales bacterium]
MHLGVLPPYRAGVVADPDWLVGFARAVEELGFESLYVAEHVVVPAGYRTLYPYSPTGRMPLPEDCPIPDPLELLAFLAGVTSRLVLGTGLLVGAAHQPLVLAKRAATVDVLSGGRLRLGIGLGWLREELDAVGVEPAERGRRVDELLEALPVVWSADEASFHGRFFSFERAVSRPRPVQPGGIPIHIGGHSAAAARRAGRFGAGYQPLGVEGAVLAERLSQMRASAVEHCRDPAGVEVTLGLPLDALDADTLARLGDAGADRVLLATREGDLAALVGRLTDVAERFLR